MNVQSDKINCYLEGIRVPIIRFTSNYIQNSLSKAEIVIPIGSYIHPVMLASALVHVTYLDTNYLGAKKEKLLYEGWCTGLEVQEQNSEVSLFLSSKFDALNYNKTLDYQAPRRYGLTKLNEGIIINIGNEDEVVISEEDLLSGWKLSERYMYLIDEGEIDALDLNSSEKLKLYYIINRVPLAERFAYVLFDQIAYNNFNLTKSPASRVNLLAKIDPDKSQRDEAADLSAVKTQQLSEGIDIKFDTKRTALEILYIGDLKNPGEEMENVKYSSTGKILQHSNKAVNFLEYAKNNPKNKYVGSYGGSGSQQWCTPEAAEACLSAAETIYNKYQSITNVGDWSELNSDGTFRRAAGHKSHENGKKVDISIPGATNSTRQDYDFNKTIFCLNAFFKSGAQLIGFQDSKRQSELSSKSGGDVRNWSNHHHHYHVEY